MTLTYLFFILYGGGGGGCGVTATKTKLVLSTEPGFLHLSSLKIELFSQRAVPPEAAESLAGL